MPSLTVRRQKTRGEEHAHHLRRSDFWEASLKPARLPAEQASIDPEDAWADSLQVELDDSQQEPSSTTAAASQDEDDPEGIEGRNRQLIFPCNEDGCIKVYQSYTNWLRHVTVGKHTKRVERHVLRDFAIDQYTQAIENSQFFNPLKTVGTVLRAQRREETASAEARHQFQPGWALKGSKRVVRFTEKQISFLTEKFQEGIDTGHKLRPEDVAELMKDHRDFRTKEKWLTPAQIRGFFSRLAKKREEEGGQQQQRGRQQQQRGRQQQQVVRAEDTEVHLDELVDDPDVNSSEYDTEQCLLQAASEAMDKPRF